MSLSTPHSSDTHQSVPWQDRIPSTNTISKIWVVALVAGHLALVTTWIALNFAQAYEGNPILGAVFHTLGFHVGVMVKLAGIIAFAGMIRLGSDYVLTRVFLPENALSIIPGVSPGTVVRKPHAREWGRFTETLCAAVMAAVMSLDALWNTSQLAIYFL